MSGQDFTADSKGQITLTLDDGNPIDHAVHPPLACKGDIEQQRPCPRTACRYHLWADDERPGRPHSPGARPPVRLRVIGSSCMWDEIREHPDGMTADEVGERMASSAGKVVGERVLQLENRGSLKMRAVDHVVAILEATRETMPNGTELELVMAHNDHALPNQHFVTVAIRVREQTAKGGKTQGVTVRKRAT
jgi:hypothetical protein